MEGKTNEHLNEECLIFDAFGYLWTFNTSRQESPLHRWILIPTVSVLCTDSIYNDHNIRYWNFDIMWLRYVLTIEVERIDKKQK